MGLFTVVISVSIGVVVSIVVCRRLMKNFIQSKLQSEHLKAIVRVVESRRGFKVVMLTRLTPIPFGLQNALFALTNMKTYKCLIASCVGLLPTQTLNTYVGSSLRSMEDVVHQRSISDYLLLTIQLGITAFLMWYVIRRARFELNKECLPTSTHEQLAKRREGRASFHDDELPFIASSVSSSKLLCTKSYSDDGDGDGERAERKKLMQLGHKRAHSASAILYAMQHTIIDD